MPIPDTSIRQDALVRSAKRRAQFHLIAFFAILSTLLLAVPAVTAGFAARDGLGVGDVIGLSGVALLSLLGIGQFAWNTARLWRAERDAGWPPLSRVNPRDILRDLWRGD